MSKSLPLFVLISLWLAVPVLAHPAPLGFRATGRLLLTFHRLRVFRLSGEQVSGSTHFYEAVLVVLSGVE